MSSRILGALALPAALLLGACGPPSERVAVPEALAAVANPCHEAFVAVHHLEVAVLPTGVDDTANLQCALDVAASRGPGAIVRLAAGDYYIAQVNVYGFEGRLTGAGMQATVIHNVPWPIPVTPIDYFTALPSADRQWSGLLFFVKGDVAVSDLSVKISGFPVTTGTTFSSWDSEPFTELQFAIAAVGEGTQASLLRVFIDAEPAPVRDEENPGASLYGTNLINAVTLAGLVYYEPISGALTVQQCRIQGAAGSVELMSLHDATVVISESELGGPFDAVDVYTGGGGLDLTVTRNAISAPYGVEFADFVEQAQPPIHDSRLVIRNNVFAGNVGIDMGASAYGTTWTFGEDVRCRMTDNDVDAVTGAGIYLGPGTKGCVVKGTPVDRVVDEGTDNVVVQPGQRNLR